MREILNDIQAGKVTHELLPWVPSSQRLRVVAESMEVEEPSLTVMNAAGRAFDWWPKSPISILTPTWLSASVHELNPLSGDRAPRIFLSPT